MSLKKTSFGNTPAAIEFLSQKLNTANWRPHAGIHANAVLPKDAWIELDTAVMDVIRDELVVVADLIAAGLVHPIADLGVTVTEWQRLKDMADAQTDMAAETAGDEDALDFSLDGAPVPITHKDFRLNIRQLLASLRAGQGLDTLSVNVATRKVRDRWEAMVVNGTGGVTSGGYTIYGLTTHPQTTTDTADNFAGGGAGSGDFSTVGNAYDVMVGMLSSLANKGYRTGPVGVYVARAQFNELMKRYADGSRQSQIASIMENLGEAVGGRIRYIKASDDLATGVVVMVALRIDVVDLAIVNLAGGQIVPVQWSSMGELGGRGILEHFKVMGAMVPRIKAFYNEAGTLVNGIVVATGA
jgi:hypothetical protein